MLWFYKENADLHGAVPPVGVGSYDLTATPGAGAQLLATERAATSSASAPPQAGPGRSPGR